MHIKIIGAILIMVCGFVFGYGKKIKYSLKTDILKGILHAIDLIHAEIQCMRTPVEDLLEKLSSLGNKELNAFFVGCNEMHKRHRELPFLDVWQKTLSNAKYMDLRRNEIDTFNEIGNCLGRYDAEEQLRILTNARLHFEIYLENAEEEKEKMGKLYGNLSILLSIALVIILF